MRYNLREVVAQLHAVEPRSSLEVARSRCAMVDMHGVVHQLPYTAAVSPYDIHAHDRVREGGPHTGTKRPRPRHPSPCHPPSCMSIVYYSYGRAKVQVRLSSTLTLQIVVDLESVVAMRNGRHTLQWMQISRACHCNDANPDMGGGLSVVSIDQRSQSRYQPYSYSYS